MSVKVKTGDTVRVIAGKDKGKEGKILSVIASENRVIVEGVNMIKKHEKPNGRNQNGGIVTKEAPIDLSNVMYLHKGQPTRIGYKMDGDKKVRIAKSNGDVLD